jgi:hypothetical protein
MSRLNNFFYCCVITCECASCTRAVSCLEPLSTVIVGGLVCCINESLLRDVGKSKLMV